MRSPDSPEARSHPHMLDSSDAVILILFVRAGGCAKLPSRRRPAISTPSASSPPLLLAFLHDMPKGGDLHNHLDGAIYAEDLIDFAASDNFCVDRTTSRLLAPPCDSCETYTAKPSIRCAYDDHVLYNQIVDAWSMRNWRPGDESGHDHFFATFDKFCARGRRHTSARPSPRVINRAAREHVQYIEFMHTADGTAAAQLGMKLGWESDFARMREKLAGRRPERNCRCNQQDSRRR